MVVLLGAGKPAISPLSVKPLVSSEPTQFEFEFQEHQEEISARLDKKQFIRMREAGTPPPPPRPPDPDELRLRLLIEKEETDAWCQNLRKNTAAYIAEMEAFRAEMRNEFQQLKLVFDSNLHLLDCVSPTSHEPKTQSSLATIPPIQPPNTQSTLAALSRTHSSTSQSSLTAAQPIHEHQSPIIHSHLWKARCKQVSLKSTAPTGGVKKPRPLKLRTVAAFGKYLKQKPQFQCFISAAFGSVSGNDTNLSLMNIGCSTIDFVIGDKLIGVDVICGNEKRKSFGKLEGVNVKQDEQRLDLNAKGSEIHALHLLDNMSKSDKGGGLVHRPLKYAIGNVKQDAHGSKGWINYAVVSTNVKNGRTEESNDGLFSSSESYGGQFPSYSDNSRKTGGHISANSYGEGVTDEEWGGKYSFDYTAESAHLEAATCITVSDGNTLTLHIEPTLYNSHAVVGVGVSVNRDELSAMDQDYAGNVRLLAVRPFNMSSAIGNSKILTSGNSSKLTFGMSSPRTPVGELSHYSGVIPQVISSLFCMNFEFLSPWYCYGSFVRRTTIDTQYVVLLLFHILLGCTYDEKNTCKSALATTNVDNATYGENRLLICMSVAEMTLQQSVQYWTSLSWAKVDVNCGGSTGYNREYCERLLRKWGTMDDKAYCLGASFLMESENVDGKRLCITVGSASGYTTTITLASQETFNAGASLHGVADLKRLRTKTYNFESHYMDNIIDDDNDFLDDSSIHLDLQFPWLMMFFHGLDDIFVLFLRYASNILLSRNNGVVMWTIIHMMGYGSKYMVFLAKYFSVFYSPFQALVRTLFPLSSMAVVQLRPVVAQVSRVDCIIRVLVLNFINQLVSLTYKQQDLEIKYGDLYKGNLGSHRHCSLYFIDLMISRFIAFGFAAIDYGDLALVPSKFFSIPMQSSEALLIILLSAIEHSLSFSNSNVSAHLCALLHSWLVTTDYDIASTATLTRIKLLEIMYYTLWGIPLFIWAILNVVPWLGYLQLNYNSELHLMIMAKEAITVVIVFCSNDKMESLEARKLSHAALCTAAIDEFAYVASALIGMHTICAIALSSQGEEAFTCIQNMPRLLMHLTQLSAATILSCCAVLPSSFRGRQLCDMKLVLSLVAIGFTVWGIWHVIRGVEENLIEETSALCNDAEGLSLIKAQMLIGDAFVTGELMCDDDFCIIPIEARVSHLGEDLNLTNLYSHMVQSMLWLQTLHSTATLDEPKALFTSISNHRNSSIVHMMMIFLICKLGNWEGSRGYFGDLNIAAFKTCLFLVFTTWHEAIVVVCALSLIIEIEEKLQCAALIQNVKLEGKFC